MKKVGAFEAKTHLPALLDRVAKGEVIQITKRGTPVAKLVPIEPDRAADKAAAAAAIRALRQSLRRGRTSIRKLIDEGRKY